MNVLLKVYFSNIVIYIPTDDSTFQITTNKLKLMNLKAVLKNYYPDCVFKCDLFLDPLKVSFKKCSLFLLIFHFVYDYYS